MSGNKKHLIEHPRGAGHGRGKTEVAKLIERDYHAIIARAISLTLVDFVLYGDSLAPHDKQLRMDAAIDKALTDLAPTNHVAEMLKAHREARKRGEEAIHGKGQTT